MYLTNDAGTTKNHIHRKGRERERSKKNKTNLDTNLTICTKKIVQNGYRPKCKLQNYNLLEHGTGANVGGWLSAADFLDITSET
jgi:hypothetical protein